MTKATKKRRVKGAPIYTLTTVGEYEETHRKTGKKYFTTRDRCVGWTPTLALARKLARENRWDAGEAGYYQFILIERCYPGIYGGIDSTYWQEWYRIPRRPMFCPPCKRIARPKKWKNTISWGIG
jgi:hypothetical protein